MDKVKEFQEMFNVERDLAEDILQQFNFDIEAAADFFLTGTVNEDVEMVNTSSNDQPPPLPPKSTKRRLSFDISFYTDEEKVDTVDLRLSNIDEGRTIGDLKDSLINKYRNQLYSLAECLGIPADFSHVRSAIRFEGMQNPSGLHNNSTLKSLHLPLKNSWTCFFKKRTRLRRPSPDNETRSEFYDFKIRVISNHANGDSGSAHSRSRCKIIPLFCVSSMTSLAELRHMAAKEVRTSAANLHWSAETSKYSNLELLVTDLNNITKDNTLQCYGLKLGKSYIFDVYSTPQPSTSKSFDVQSSGSHKSYRPHHLSKKAIVIDVENDDNGVDYNANVQGIEEDNEDDDFPIYDVSDDDDSNIRIAAETLRSQNYPLIPENLFTKPVLAVENFFSVFIQRYCNTSDVNIPPFCLMSFGDAFAQTLGIQRACERKPLLIYLHNDRSVAANLFCTKILCSNAMVAFLEENNLQIWPWDVTLEKGKEVILRWLEPRLSNVISDIQLLETQENYPLLIMICKVAGAYEIAAVITGHGNFHTPMSSVFATIYPDVSVADDDDFPALEPSTSGPPASSRSNTKRDRGGLNAPFVVSQLEEKMQLYLQLLAPERQADSERLARENVREEQDRAYKESLRHDRLKKEAKEKELAELEAKEVRAREMAKEVERAALEKQKLAARSLPKEPNPGVPGITTIRFRLPQTQPHPPAFEGIPEESRPIVTNGFIVRRFNGLDTLKDLKNFIESLGYSVQDFKLLRTYPRVDLTAIEESDDQTMTDLKLVPQETLNLEKR